MGHKWEIAPSLETDSQKDITISLMVLLIPLLLLPLVKLEGDVCHCNGPPPDTACVGAEECQDYHCVGGSCVLKTVKCQDIGEECFQDGDCCEGSYCCDYTVCSSP